MLHLSYLCHDSPLKSAKCKDFTKISLAASTSKGHRPTEVELILKAENSFDFVIFHTLVVNPETDRADPNDEGT